jgi:hypothetical protein
LGFDPLPFSFYQLMKMRRAAEVERWDRLSFHIAHQAAFAGNKDIKINAFHKFHEDPKKLTAEKLKSLKGLF